MIDDPDDPGYRYPEPGERFWHRPRQTWVTVCPPGSPPMAVGLQEISEAMVTVDGGGERFTAKLRSLDVER